MLPNPEIREVTLEDYIKIVRKRLWIIAVLLVIMPTVTAVYVFRLTPVYKATVSLLIEKKPPKITKFEEVYEPAGAGAEYFQTQIKVLTSRVMAERVFNGLKLSADPEYINLRDPVAKLLAQVQTSPLKNSQVLFLNIDDTDPLRASAIANTWAKQYIQQDIETRNVAIKEAVVFLEAQVADIKKRMEQAEQALNKYVQENRIVVSSDAEKKTESLLEGLKQTKVKLENELAELSKRYMHKHPKMIALYAQLEDINKKIEQETNNLLDLNQKMVQYNFLKKEAQTNQELYSTLLTRTKETSISEQIEISNIRILDAAMPPESPYKPKKQQSVMMAVLMAIFCGVAISFLLEYLDSAIRTADDVGVFLSLPFLGYIPKSDKEARSDLEKDLISQQKPRSAVTESYRAIRTSLLFASPEDKPLKIILITSSFPKEGKSFFSINLSTIFSQVNEKVVLMDVDMRRPRLHKVFNMELKNGLSNFLIGTVPLEKALKPSFIPNLSVITAGDVPPNPSELLSSGKIRALFDELKLRFDRIIVDSPPILVAADTSLLANIADGVVFVLRAGKTNLRAASTAKEKIAEAKGRVIGVVINDAEPAKEDKYYYYHYYYGEGEKKGKG